MESPSSSSTLHNRRAGASSTNNNNNAAGASSSSSSKKTNQVHISERSMTLSNWHEHINWLNTTLIVIIPAIGFLMAPFVRLQLKTFILSVILYSLSGFGITAGYHRLWSHRAYSARLPLRIFLAFIGGGAVEGSIRWWSNGHRTHHRFTDTDKDPYNVKRGLMYAHMGWMVLKGNPKLKGRTDISDLNADPVVRWQHRNYVYVLLFMGFILPTLIAGLGWGDYWGGLVYGGILRVCCIHHATFCVNSLAHYIGEQPFDDRRSPRDHVLTALVTFGEGYHNFHHEFPSDYRNAIKWYQYDPTKLLIKACYYLGLAYDLKTFSSNAIQQGLVQQQQKKIDQWRSRLDWGVPLEQLPVMDFDDFKEKSKDRALVVVAGVVHDVTDFIDEHPGGKALIASGIGKDATANFNGGVYDHSNAAHNVLSTKRVAVIRGGGEVEIWKQAHLEKKDATIAVDSYNRPIVRAGNQVSRVVVPVPGADAA